MTVAPRKASQPRRPNGAGEMPSRSVRVSDEAWERAKRRANYEGVSMSNMVAQLVEGYGKGFIDLPRTQVVYTPPKAGEAS